MGDLTFSDAEIEPEAHASFFAPAVHRTGGRGRPRGTFGSRLLRDELGLAAGPQEAPADQPELSSIEKARQCRAENVAARRRDREVLQEALVLNQAHSRVTDSGMDSLKSYAPLTCLTPVALKKPVFTSLLDALRQCLPKANAESADLLTEKALDGAMSSMSFKAFDKEVGGNNSNARVLLVASCLFQAAMFLWSALLLILTSGCVAAKPVLCIVRLRYDETPTRVRMKDHKQLGVQMQASMLQSKSPEQLASMNLLGSETFSTFAKVFQVDMSVGTLLHDENRDRFVWCFGQVPAALYGLEKTTGRNTFLALRDTLESLPAYKAASQHFPINLRHSCSDRYTANFTAEEYLSAEYPDATLMHLPCDVHKLYTCIKGMLRACERDVAGCLAFALAFGEPGIVPRMRQALAKILFRLLEIVPHEKASGFAEQHRKHVLDLFCPVVGVSAARSKLNRKRRFVLSYYLNGCWWEDGGVTHHCGIGCCQSPEQTLKGFVVFVAWALVPTRCPIFPRSRWTRSDEAIDFVGLLAAVHNLLNHLTIALTGGETKKPPDPQVGEVDIPPDRFEVLDNQAALDQSEWESMMAEELHLPGAAAPSNSRAGRNPDPQGQETDFMEADFEQPDNEQEQGDAQNQDEPAETSGAAAPIMSNEALEPDWVKEKRKNKKKARRWAESTPLARLVVLKEALAVMMRLMYRFLYITGTSFENQQRHLSATGQDRDYRILVAHVGKDTDKAMADLRALFSAPPLATVNQDFTPRIRSIRVRLLGRALCHLHALIRLPRSTWHWRDRTWTSKEC